MTARRIAWSADEDAALRRLAAANQPASRAAAETGRTRNSVISRARLLGVTFASTVENRKPVAPAWSDADIAILRRMAGEGASSQAIAEALGRTSGAVNFRACIEKIPIPRPKAAPKPPKAPKPQRTIADAPRRRVAPRATQNGGRAGARVSSLPCAPASIPPVPAPVPLPPPPPPPPGGVGFMDLGTRHCRRPLWPNGARPSVEEMRFCGGETRPGSSWCPACLPRMGTTLTAMRSEAQAHLAAQARAGKPLRMAWGPA